MISTVAASGPATSCIAPNKARNCMVYISGAVTASRLPRCPSIGFASCKARMRSRTSSGLISSTSDNSSNASSAAGRNSCKGGSSRRIVTGSPAITDNRPAKSARCSGSSATSAASRWGPLCANIMRRTCKIRVGLKNICSVRHKPIPAAPKRRARLASSIVSALARTCMRWCLPTQAMTVPKSPDNSGSKVGTRPCITRPDAPSMVMTSPSRNSWAPIRAIWVS